MDLRTFFIFAETLLKNEQELKELNEKQLKLEKEYEAEQKEISEFEDSIKKHIRRIKEEAKNSVALYENKVDYTKLGDWLTNNMTSFERTCAPVIQALLDDNYEATDRANVLSTMYPEIFAKFLEVSVDAPLELTKMVADKNLMVRQKIELDKKLSQLSSAKTDVKKRIPKVESAYNFPLKQTLEIVTLRELEAWEQVLPLIKMKLAAYEAEKLAAEEAAGKTPEASDKNGEKGEDKKIEAFSDASNVSASRSNPALEIREVASSASSSLEPRPSDDNSAFSAPKSVSAISMSGPPERVRNA